MCVEVIVSYISVVFFRQTQCRSYRSLTFLHQPTCEATDPTTSVMPLLKDASSMVLWYCHWATWHKYHSNNPQKFSSQSFGWPYTTRSHLTQEKKHLKNVGPICHNEPPHANSPGVATTPTTTRDRGDLYGPMEWAQKESLWNKNWWEA